MDMHDFFSGHRLVLAPMAGVSDVAFRALCREQGADVAYTEMVSAMGLSYENVRTRGLLELAPGEREVVVQLFGHEPGVMARQAAWVEDELGERLAYVDINMGCPARKIVSKGDGSALMRDPDLAASIVTAVSGAIAHPLSVKFRRGWQVGEETAPDFARRMEAAGAACVAVHGRYSKQLYQGSADWGSIARVRAAVDIPVVGNGDVRSGADAREMIARTGCHAVMVGRGSQGNPWVFAEARAALEGKEIPAPPGPRERLETARRHARLLAEHDERSLVRMRRHAMWYLTGLPGASAARARVNACVTLDDFEALIDELLERLAESDPSGRPCAGA